jgi:uncharacterized surface protein with fasciclin (FAS1) repeats
VKKITIIIVLAALLLGTTATASAQSMVTTGPIQGNIIQAATEQGNLKTFAGAIDAAGMRETLMSGGPYTVFAPTDDAFNSIPANTMNALMADKGKMSAVAKNHVMQGRYTVRDLAKIGYVTTLDGKKIPVTSSDSTFAVDGARIIKNDVPAGNGIIHVIDTVMIPK